MEDGKELNLIELIGRRCEVPSQETEGVIRSVRVDHRKDVHIEAEWVSPTRTVREWKKLTEVVVVQEECDCIKRFLSKRIQEKQKNDEVNYLVKIVGDLKPKYRPC